MICRDSVIQCPMSIVHVLSYIVFCRPRVKEDPPIVLVILHVIHRNFLLYRAFAYKSVTIVEVKGKIK